MAFIDDIYQRAKTNLKRIALPESTDERILRASVQIKEQGIAIPVLVGNRNDIQNKANELNLNIREIEIFEQSEEHFNKFSNDLYELRKDKGMTLEKAREELNDGACFSIMMLHNNLIDGVVSGAVHSTANTLSPALKIIKTKPGIKTASSFFFMLQNEKIYLFSDCGFVIDPTSEQLADITMSTATSAREFGIEPRAALLSFSTMGSATHEKVDKVKEAVKILEQRNPDFTFDGELQLDAAIVPKVAELKAPNSRVKGDANVLIFPDLNAGNIGYKLVQRFGGATALGPIVQGLNKPVNDLSRGCSSQDVVDVVAITSIQAQLTQ
ncbi:phosphate acetyltransferase [Candidatus Woesearchaeota archaeon]|nr:phosphate acetyltransferase [Candidatus Woesearchaeota archaeon]